MTKVKLYIVLALFMLAVLVDFVSGLMSRVTELAIFAVAVSVIWKDLFKN